MQIFDQTDTILVGNLGHNFHQTGPGISGLLMKHQTEAHDC